MGDEKLFARVTLTVDVYIGLEPGINNSSAYELPYEYLVAREANHTDVEFFGNPAAGILAEEGGSEDLDADGVILDAVKSALNPVEEN